MSSTLKFFQSLTSKKALKHLNSDLDTENHDSTYLLERLRHQFGRQVPKGKRAGVVYQEMVKHWFRKQDTTPDEVLEAFEPIKVIINTLYLNIQTRQKIYGELRKVLERFGAKSRVVLDSKKNLAITYQQYEDIRAQQEQRRDEASRNRKQFERQSVIDLIYKLRGSEDFKDKVILVCLTTGARFIEVLRISTFIPVPTNPNEILVQSVAKKKDKSEEFQVIRPLLVLRAEEVVPVVEDIRTITDSGRDSELTNTQLSGKYNSSINRRLKTYGLGGTLHDLRKLYGTLTYEFYTNRNKTSLNAWLKNILGHERLETSLHYNTIALRSHEEPLDAHVELLDSEIRSLTESLKQAKEQCTLLENYDPKVAVFLKDGQEVLIPKLQRTKGDTTRLQRAIDKTKELIEAGIQPTTRNLLKLGIGSATVSEVLKAL